MNRKKWWKQGIVFLAGIVMVGCTMAKPTVEGRFKGESALVGKVNEKVETYINQECVSIKRGEIRIKNTGESAISLVKDVYGIDCMTENGWRELQPINEIRFSNCIRSLVYPNSDLVFSLNWENVYGELPFGKYRVVFMLNNLDASEEIGYAVAEFIIEKGE